MINDHKRGNLIAIMTSIWKTAQEGKRNTQKKNGQGLF